ncbi:MAG: nitrogenase-stabilizing/protective protein NifW [Gallionellaceae bacterium]|nr:nitrogenase-stabilizing/protective protein NifW [Gallionellaceae bacterium]MDD5365674.1 nitrogenase-stabilizing/protective protein NifW [Gallionellaceae bacterium]
MDELTLDEALEELESAEDFLNFFGIAYEPSVVHVNRLHILQRFHNYIAKTGGLPEDEGARRAAYTALLARAYEDFVESDALTEKVFKVFHMHEPQTTFVPLTAITVAQPVVIQAPETGGCGCGSKGACHSSEAALRS